MLQFGKGKSTTEEKVTIVCELQLKYPLKILLKISGLKRLTYYYTLSKTNKDMKNDEVMNIIINIFYAHKKRYGYRRITLELKSMGYTINHKRVKRLMSVMGVYGKIPKVKYKSYKGDMNGTTKNLLLGKVVDDKNIRHITRETSTQQVATRYGLQMYQNSISSWKTLAITDIRFT